MPTSQSGAKIKGSNIYTVERRPKTIKASVEKVKATDAKNRNVNATEAKKSYRKSTIHQSEAKDKGLSRFKRNIRESNELPSRPRRPIFTLQEELEHLQPEQLQSR